MECRELDGVTTEERFLIFLEAFQRASRSLIFVLLYFRLFATSHVSLNHPLMAVFVCNKSPVF